MAGVGLADLIALLALSLALFAVSHVRSRVRGWIVSSRPHCKKEQQGVVRWRP